MNKVTKELIIVLIIVLVCLLSDNLFAQTKVFKDESGNYIAAKQQKKLGTDKPTGNNFTAASGEILPIYVSGNGKFYVIRTAKNSGNQYKQYLKLD